MKVLVTGGLGQIGSHVVEMCLERGDDVVAVDNLTTGRIEHLVEHPKLRIVLETITDKDKMTALFEEFKPDSVVHTAASYKDPDDWYNDTLTNCVGGALMVNLSKQVGVKRFVYFQTALCYGLEPEHSPIPLSHARNPAGSSYAISKTTNEYYLEQIGRASCRERV